MRPTIYAPKFRAATPKGDNSPRQSPNGTPEPAVNHIAVARNEFTNAFGDLAKGKRNWQLIAFALAAVLAIETIAYSQLAASSRVVPYLVQVDRLGQVVAVGTAEEMKSPDQRLIASQLAQFIRSIRTVLPASAAVAQAEMMRRGYAFAAPEAATFLNDYFASPKNDPRILGARITRQVEVTSVIRVPSSDVWRLQWAETERSTQPGGPTRVTAWEGYVTVKLLPPTTAEVIQDNPLGLYATSVTWTQVADGAAAAPSGAETDSSVNPVPNTGARP